MRSDGSGVQGRGPMVGFACVSPGNREPASQACRPEPQRWPVDERIIDFGCKLARC